MKKILALIALAALTGCGADGEPEPPKVSATQTIGVNSESGAFSRTSLAFTFGG